jgi:hypothetical protein
MKNQITRGLIATVLLMGSSWLAGCSNNTQPESASAPESLQGTWAYQSTDGQDLSGYGITYAFQGTIWTYTLGEAGQKQYDFSTLGNTFEATLQSNGINSVEQAGSKIRGQYEIFGDTLKMMSGGHTAVLIKE